MSERTIKLKESKNILLAMQLLLMLGTVCFLIIAMLNSLEIIDHEAVLSEKYEAIVTSLGISLGLTSAMLLIVGHKVRNTIWMGSVLLSSYLYGTKGLWVVFAIWLLDEYIVYPLYKSCKTKYNTNREIDRRGV